MQIINSWLRGAVALVFFVNSIGALADYRDHPNASVLIERVAAKGVDRAWLEAALAEASKQDSILKAISRPAEKVSLGLSIRISSSPIVGRKKA